MRPAPSLQPGGRCQICALLLTSAIAGFAFGCSLDAATIELTVSDHNPTGSPPALAVDYWAEQVTGQTGGKLKLVVHHDGALLNRTEAYQGLKTGIADVAYYVLNRSDGLELNSIMALPFMGWPNQLEASQMYLELLEDHQAMNREWQGVRIIGVMMMAGTHLHNVVGEVRTPADLTGFRIGAFESLTADSVRAGGAVAVDLDSAEMASSLAYGMIQAVMSHFSELASWGVLDSFEHHTLFGEGGVNMSPALIIMNDDVYNSLPSNQQTIIAASGSWYQDEYHSLDVSAQADAVAQAEEWDHSFVRLTPEEIEVWSNLVKDPVHKMWLANCEAAGLPAQAVYDDVLKRIEEAAGSP